MSEFKACGRTVGHGDSCAIGWLCASCKLEFTSIEALERVTAERDAARGRLNELLEDFQLMSDQCDRRGVQASAFEERMGDLQVMNGKLQQRLTAADERVGVLEGLLRRYYNTSHACAFRADDISAVLKPTEGGGDGLDEHDRSAQAYWEDQAAQGKPYEQQLREACERNGIGHGLDAE